MKIYYYIEDLNNSCASIPAGVHYEKLDHTDSAMKGFIENVVIFLYEQNTQLLLLYICTNV